MYSYVLNVVSSISILVPASIVVVNFKKENASFLPFKILLMIGVFNEALSWYYMLVLKNNLVIGNIYVLIESLFLVWQLSLWSKWKNSQIRNIYLAFFLITIWIVDNLIVHNITTVNSLFRVFYSLVIVFLSIEQINFVFVTERNSIITNARFLLSGAFVIFYTYKAVFEVFYMINVKMSDGFYNSLFQVLILINLFTNLIFAFSVSCIPKKQKFTLPF